jgi:serine/threonine protein kinase
LAVKGMHESGIIHRDIKNANILLHLPFLEEVSSFEWQKRFYPKTTVVTDYLN